MDLLQRTSQGQKLQIIQKKGQASPKNKATPKQTHATQAYLAELKGQIMAMFLRVLIALVLPWLTFFTIGRPFAGIIALILQITLVGWLPVAIWAVIALLDYDNGKR